MRIFTDCPEMFPAEQVVCDSNQAEIFILFTPGLVRKLAAIERPVYLVAERMPLSLANSGSGVRLMRPADLVKRIGGVGRNDSPQQFARAVGSVEDVPNVIVSYSPGTGVGKTFIASNMAAWLALNGRRAVLLDLDMEGSGTWEILGLKNSSLVAPAVSGWNGDPETFPQELAKGEHPRIGGMYMLKRGEADASEVVRAVRTLAGLGFTVVVDTSNNRELPYIDSVMRLARKVFLVATLTLKVQTRLAEMYATARSATGLVEKMALCVNRVGYHEEDNRLRPEDLARQFMAGRHYVVHENARSRKSAFRKKTLLVAVKSPLAKELEVMFESEFSEGGSNSGVGNKRSVFWGFRKVIEYDLCHAKKRYGYEEIPGPVRG